ncbi:MAG: tetratricopeptide repeat protein, partial [Lachnospiraceae bacterium]|nr:tetratricopeptide repeat protein [Lachnospiraceae bacterium]
MNLENILAQYDAMFGKNSLNEIEEYLVEKITEAKNNAELGILVTLLNEIIGFCRDTTQKEKALHYCDELQRVLHEMQLEGRIDYATSLLNVANAYRAFGLFEESLHLYEIVENTYKGQVAPTDFMYASLYNNWSLLYQEMKDYEKARDMLLKALLIADSYENAVIPQATTRANLAATLLQIGTEEAYQEAIGYLKEALAVHEKEGGGDFHYGAVLVAMGDAYSFKQDYENAAIYYEKGLYEIEKHVGRTDNYTRVLEKYEYVKGKLEIEKENEKTENANAESGADKDWVSNLERCKKFYENYGKEMIHNKFPEYENRIAVGLVGEGSDCFGFDDEISTDHDYELG